MVVAQPAVVVIALIVAVFANVLFFYVWVLLSHRPPGAHRLYEIVLNWDRWPSLAKFQFAVWTVIMLPIFTWVYLVRILSGVSDPIGDLPVNILALLGINVVSVPISDEVSKKVYGSPPTNAAAKAQLAAQPAQPFHTMLQESGQLSLSRLQMFMWTFISVMIYLVVVAKTFLDPAVLGSIETLRLPDIDPTLVTLMGLSQTGYIGAKAALGPK